jgi:GR25 family glycosyltransferase involved in LPS biosynthesis
MNINLGHHFFRRLKFYRKQFFRTLSYRSFHKSFAEEAQGALIDSVYVINLKRQPERWLRIASELKREKLSDGLSLLDLSHKVEAIDGKLLDTAVISPLEVNKIFNIRDQYTVDPDPRLLEAIRDREILINMTPEEIAVTQSHIACWRRMVAEKRSYSLILEDDIFFEHFFSRKLNLLWKELPLNDERLPDFDVLYLSYREVDWGAEKISFSPHLNKPSMGLWWLSGYVLSYKGAQKLLDLLPVQGPVDLWINLQFSKLKVYSSFPSLIFQRDDLPSGNNYSIMPVLSQLGIQSDKTHLELQQKKGKNPVFVFAQDQSTIERLATVLGVLGYRCRWDSDGFPGESLKDVLHKKDALLFDAYLGKDIAKDWLSLASMYPSAIFIWVVTDSIKTFSQGKKSLLKIMDFAANPGGFDNKTHLILGSGQLNWKKLCSFLNCQIPPFSFPILPTLVSLSPNLAPVELGLQPDTVYLEHDVTPWILPVQRLGDYGVWPIGSGMSSYGCFQEVYFDDFTNFDRQRWRLLDDSFPSNLAQFVAENYQLAQEGFELLLDNALPVDSHNNKYASASIVSQEPYRYGKFSVIMKAVKMDGVVTAFFLHRNDPWQELDIEFLGKDTTRVLLNVFYNPGSDGSGWNYGIRGTPVWVDLGFDASDDFHEYSIEWDCFGVRWLVDDQIIHSRNLWQPSLIPDQPMALYVNLWPSASEELAGKFFGCNLPVRANIKSIKVSSWHSADYEGLSLTASEALDSVESY